MYFYMGSIILSYPPIKVGTLDIQAPPPPKGGLEMFPQDIELAQCRTTAVFLVFFLFSLSLCPNFTIFFEWLNG